MSKEPSAKQLAIDVLARLHGQFSPAGKEAPIWRWERWIREHPEAAWEVCVALSSLAPEDPDVLESVAHRTELVLSRHWEAFHERAVELRGSSALLRKIMDPAILEKEHYLPRGLAELASHWLHYNAHSGEAHKVDEILKTDYRLGLTLVLEIIDRAPLHGLSESDVSDPLMTLLRFHGEHVIEELEQVATESVALRRTIWSARKLNPDPDRPHAVSTDVWVRILAAAGSTNTYNSEQPIGVRNELPAKLEHLLQHWFEAERTFWAYMEVDELLDDDPEEGWKAIQAILDLKPGEETLGSLGAGLLEDLIRHHPGTFVDRIEVLAKANSDFRQALGGVWLTLDDVPEPLARRYVIASGGELAVLDAPPGWPS